MQNALTRAQNKYARQMAAQQETEAELEVLNRALDNAKAKGNNTVAILGAIQRATTKLKRQRDAVEVTLAEIDIFSGDQISLDISDTKSKK